METNERGSDAHGGFADAQGQYQAQEFQTPSEGSIRDEILAWKRAFTQSILTIFSIMIVSVCVALAIFVWAPLPLTGTLELRPLPANKTSEYLLLQSAENQALKLFSREAQGTDANIRRLFFPTNSNELIAALTSDLLTRDSIKQAIKQNNVMHRDAYSSDEEYDTEVSKEAYSFEILEPDSPDDSRRSARKRWKLVYSANDENIVRDVMFDALEISNKNIQEFYGQKLAEITQTLGVMKSQIIDRIDLNISLAKQGYEGRTKRQKAILQEQAEIARVLGIAKNTVEARSFNSDNTFVAVSEAPGPTYYRGYEALEKELSLLSSRENPENYITELTELEVNKTSIEQSPVIRLLKSGYEASPLSSENFESAEYDKFAISVKRSFFHYLIPAIAILFGLFLCLMVLVSRRYQ